MSKNLPVSRILLILFISLLCSLTITKGQKINVQWSPEYEDEKGEVLGRILHDDGEFIYVFVSKSIKRGKDGVTPGIIKFDRKMQPVKREDYSTSSQEEVKFGGMVYCGGNFLMVASIENKKTNSKEIFGVVIDKGTLKMAEKPISLYTMTAPPKVDTYWDYELSDDSSKLLITATMEQKDNESRKFAYIVYDKDYKTVQKNVVTLTQSVENSKILDYAVTNSGEVYLVGKSYMDGAKKETSRSSGEKKASYDIMMKRYNVDGSVKDFTIPMGKNLLDDYVMRTDRNSNDVYLLGTIKSVDDKGITGYFFTRIDSKTGSVMAAKENKFTLPFITRVNKMSDDKTKGDQPGISSYFNVSDLIISKDGVLYGILEKNFSVVTQSKYGSYTTYHSQGIIPFQLDRDGNQKWINFIPKTQFYNSMTTYLYHSTMMYDGKLMVLYNDHSGNLEKDLNSDDEPKRFNALKEMSFIMVTIDQNGKMVRKELANSEQMETCVNIALTKQTTDNHFLIYGYKVRKKLNKLGLAEFNL